jgi:mRNA interferase RelE/StbE
MYKIDIGKRALKELERLPKNIVAKFREKFEELANDPYKVSGVKKIDNPKTIGLDLDEVYRVRVGDYRAVYSIENDILVIHIWKSGHRKDIYD